MNAVQVMHAINLGDVGRLATRFTEVLESWLDADEFAEMKATNATPDYIGDSCCASHNYCDANMAMDEAMRDLFGAEYDAALADGSFGDPAEDNRFFLLWNAAWTYAKSQYLTASAS